MGAREPKLNPEDLPVLMELLYRHYVLDEHVAHIVTPSAKQQRLAKAKGRPRMATDALPISRSKAEGMIRYARQQGFIETVVHLQPDEHEKLNILALQACRPFGVRTVHVFPSIGDDQRAKLDRFEYRAFLRRSLGAFAARYVERLKLKPGDHVSVGGGTVMASFAQHFSPAVRDLVFRPLTTGGRWRPIGSADAAAVVQALVTRLGAMALCPELPPAAPRTLWRRPEVRAVFTEEARPPRVAIAGLGWVHYVESKDPQGLGPHKGTSSFVQLVAHAEHYAAKGKTLAKKKRLGEEDLALFYDPLPDGVYAAAAAGLERAGILGDVCRHGITAKGTVKSTALQRTSLAVSPELLRAWREAGLTETIVVAGGSRLAPILRAVLKMGCFKTLVLDSALALQLVPRNERPEGYRDVPTVGEALT